MHKKQDKNFAAGKQQKREKRTRKSQKKAKPDAFWVLERMGTVENGYNQMRKPGVRTQMNTKTMQHKKETGENPVFSPVFWQGQKDLNPRHAVLEWMWENAARSGGGAMFPGSRRKSQNRRCWFGAVGKFCGQEAGKMGGKFPEKP